MSSLGSALHLQLDNIARSALAARRSTINRREDATGLGASLPGGQVFLAAEVVSYDGFELLRSGDTKHSMWRTVEWCLLREMFPAFAKPVLDLGCGDGGFGALLSNRIELGIDGDADAVGQCDPAVYGATFAGDLRQTLPVPDGSVATAFSNSTLEHVEPLAPAIAAASRALQSGGRLIATVPTSGFTDAMTAAYSADFAARMNRTLGHHNLWTWAQWQDLLHKNGFGQVKFRGYLSRPAVAWYCRRNLVPWPQLARRRGGWLWQHDLPELRRHVEESLREGSESETACVLIDATRE